MPVFSIDNSFVILRVMIAISLSRQQLPRLANRNTRYLVKVESPGKYFVGVCLPQVKSGLSGLRDGSVLSLWVKPILRIHMPNIMPTLSFLGEPCSPQS